MNKLQHAHTAKTTPKKTNTTKIYMLIPRGLITLYVTYMRIPLALMGVLATGSAHARPTARPPIDTSGNFSAHMSGGGEIV